MKALLFVLLTVAVSAFGELRPSSYKGKFIGNRKKVYLMLREAVGREGSFLGVILTKDQLALYVIDQAKPGSNSYVMTPLEVISDGIIGIHNDDPSLTLTVLKEEEFTITVSNSNNRLGITKAMRFYDETDDRVWLDAIPGKYSKYSEKGKRGKGGKRVKRALVISNMNLIDQEADAQFFSGLNGPHIIAEQFSGMYTILARRYVKTGEEVDRNPRKIGVFIKKKGKRLFYVVNPDNSKDRIIFKHRK